MGTFYICPTPIGNLNDISTRLVQVLSEVEIIYAEDTRVAKKLLSHLNQKKEVRSYFKGNEVKKIDENVFKIANKTTGEYGSGGMLTKIEAAKICGLAGCKMVISSGLILNPLKHINLSKECTWFLPEISKLDARKKWIASSVSPKGELMIDNGAIIALKKGKSLLAAGIKNIKGNFDKGDHIKIVDEKNFELGRGLSSFSSEEIGKIKGQHSDKINKILGYKTKSEVVHKDDMVGFSK